MTNPITETPIKPMQSQYRNDAGQLHRLDGPALIVRKLNFEFWWINGVGITDEVRAWIKENELPTWREWSPEDWVLFALRFRGQ